VRVFREGHLNVLYGANGRRYEIIYAIGNKRPWILNGQTDWDKRFNTLDEAVSRAHEIEAVRLSEEEGQR
jgi:hypothetical protein